MKFDHTNPMAQWLIEAKAMPIVTFLATTMVNKRTVTFESKAVEFGGLVTSIKTMVDPYTLAIELNNSFTFLLDLRYLDEWSIIQ